MFTHFFEKCKIFINQQYAWVKKLGVTYLFDKYLPKHFGKNMYIAKKMNMNESTGMNNSLNPNKGHTEHGSFYFSASMQKL